MRRLLLQDTPKSKVVWYTVANKGQSPWKDDSGINVPTDITLVEV